jgi:hypothetical protein
VLSRAILIDGDRWDLDDELDEASRLLADAPVGRGGFHVGFFAVASELERRVAAAWEAGWQPADVARVVGRELGSRASAVAIDTIAAQRRAFATLALHPTWQAQLEELQAEAWWVDGDLTRLEQRARRDGVGGLSILRDAIDVLRLLCRLPVIATLIPPPGASPSGGRAATRHATVDARILSRVRALLAKAESTDFEEEASALTAKAQELMSRYAIDAAMVADPGDEPIGSRIAVEDPYAGSRALLLQVVAEANRCRAVWSSFLGASTVIGFPAEVEVVEVLYTSLLTQGTKAMLATGRHDRQRRVPSFRRSFLAAFAVRIGERLRIAAEHAAGGAQAVHGDRLLPVLAARRSVVDERVDAMFPETTRNRSASYNPAGWVAGAQAADLADLGPALGDRPSPRLALAGEPARFSDERETEGEMTASAG